MPSTKQVIAALASGVDPETGELVPEDSVLQRPSVIRALYAALKAVEQSGGARTGPPNGWNPWTQAEDNQLRSEHANGQSVASIAKNHGRTRAAIDARLLKLGLIDVMSARGVWGSAERPKA